MKPLSQFVRLATLLSFLICSTSAVAGGGGIRNGGDLDEIKLLKLYDRITRFLGTPDGIRTFPEVRQADFAALRPQLTFSIVDSDLKDSNGESRSELNFSGDDGKPHVQFSRDALSHYLGDEAELYVILMHSGLNLMKKELARETWTSDVKPSSIYSISRKLIPFTPRLNADGEYPAGRVIVCSKDFWKRSHLKRQIYTLDPTTRMLQYDEVNFLVDLKSANSDTRTLPNPPSIIRPFLAQSIRGQTYKAAFVHPKDKSVISQATVALPSADTIDSFSAMKLAEYFDDAKDLPSDRTDLLTTVIVQPAPGSEDPILECFQKKGSVKSSPSRH